MYIPKMNSMPDTDEMLTFMHRFSFATLVTARDGIPTATHLPFVIEKKDEQVTLISHFARANPQWEDIEDNPVLVIFTEPHAYISTAHYDKVLNVPTWNYVSVHAYGKAVLLNEEETRQVIDLTINNYEAEYQEHWASFGEEYKQKMLNGIVAFRVVIDNLQGKKKISQNRSETEKRKIIDSLSGSDAPGARLVAEYMKNEHP